MSTVGVRLTVLSAVSGICQWVIYAACLPIVLPRIADQTYYPGMKMKIAMVSLGLILLLSPTAFAAESQNPVPEAKTKIEQFSARTGVVIVRGFQRIGKVGGLYSTAVTVESKEFTNVSDGSKVYGITIETY